MKFTLFKNVFAVIYELGDTDGKKAYPLTLGGIQKWIRDEYGYDVSKSSITAVKDKCGADSLAVDAGKRMPVLKSEKELMVLDAFIHFGILKANATKAIE